MRKEAQVEAPVIHEGKPSGTIERPSSNIWRRRLAVGATILSGMLAAGASDANLASAESSSSANVEVVQSGPGGQHLAELPGLSFQENLAVPAEGPTIKVNDSKRYQAIWGVGAAMTNSSAYLIEKKLNVGNRDQLMEQLFAPDQDNLSMVRISIGGSDYNKGGQRYSEDDMPSGKTDPNLNHFNLRHDRNTITALRQALKINPDIKVIASPWTAPGWMKTNDSLTNRHFQGNLKPQYYGTYARYFAKFVEGYKKAGIPIYAVTAQNEPVNVPASYEGMNFPVGQAAYFIKQYLRPALRSAGLRTKIYGTDESWNQSDYAKVENGAAAGLDGQAWHCYTGNPDTTMPKFSFMPQIMSECALSLIRSPAAPIMANIFNDGASAGMVWNLALKPNGGPVIQPDRGCPDCQGVVTINPSNQEVTHNSSYYQLGQYGRFIQPGTRRIAATRMGHFRDVIGSNRATQGLQDVAFRNPDGTDELVVYNNDSNAASFKVAWRGRSLPYKIPGLATTTFKWPAK